MVWQDFAMACNVYSNNSNFERLIKEEAEWVVKEYRNHCSIAIWSGDNEIDAQINNQGTDPIINKVTREFIPEILNAHDPKRPYVASSPYISSAAFKAGYASHPEEHLWGPRDYYKSSFYADSKAYFVSETGYHGCPSKASIEKFIDADKVWPYANNSQWTLHSSDQNNSSHRVWLMHNQVIQLFGKVPTDMEEYILASQISQAEAKKFFIERVRCKMNYMGGIIWWNLLDGWPQMSDAVVDYYYDKKLAFDFIKRSSRDFIIMLDEIENWGQKVVCCNSSLKEIKGKCTIVDLSDDKVVFEKEFTAEKNANTILGKINVMYSKKTMFLIKWELENGEEYYNTYLAGMPAFDLNEYKKWLSKLP
jgi:beta-mannosidase